MTIHCRMLTPLETCYSFIFLVFFFFFILNEPYPVKPITITPNSACTARTGYIHGKVIFDRCKERLMWKISVRMLGGKEEYFVEQARYCWVDNRADVGYIFLPLNRSFLYLTDYYVLYYILFNLFIH